MLFRKQPYSVINPPIDTLEIFCNDKIYTLDKKDKDWEKQIEKLVDKGVIDWSDVSKHSYFSCSLSEEFMRKHVEDLDWWSMVHGRNHSKNMRESFLREIFDYVDFTFVAHNCLGLSKDIIREMYSQKDFFWSTFRTDQAFEEWLDEHIASYDQVYDCDF